MKHQQKTNKNVNEVFNFLTEEILKINEGKRAGNFGFKKEDKKEGKKGC